MLVLYVGKLIVNVSSFILLQEFSIKINNHHNFKVNFFTQNSLVEKLKTKFNYTIIDSFNYI